jgi:uncharacterized membrane protein YtjA (UPF0391 family)
MSIGPSAGKSYNGPASTGANDLLLSNARRTKAKQGGTMLRWALIFFVVALIAAVFGFFGLAVAAAGIAKILFFIFLVLFLVSLVGGLVRRA